MQILNTFREKTPEAGSVFGNIFDLYHLGAVILKNSKNNRLTTVTGLKREDLFF